MAEMTRDEWRAVGVALCVDDDRPLFSHVVVEGTAEVSEDLRAAVPGELLVGVTPARVVADENISD